MVSSDRYHVVAVSETWLDDSVPDNKIKLPDYDIVRHDRVGRVGGGGGVCLYVHNSIASLKVLERSRSEPAPHVEYLFVELKVNHISVLMSVVYRAPNAPLPYLFTEDFERLAISYQHIILVGDFNCNMLELTSNSKFMLDFINSHALYMSNHCPTHHTYYSTSNFEAHTLLDLFIVDSACNVLKFSQSGYPFISGHELITLEYAVAVPATIPRTLTSRNFRNLDIVKLRATLDRSIRESPVNFLTPDTAVASLNHCILCAFDTMYTEIIHSEITPSTMDDCRH